MIPLLRLAARNLFRNARRTALTGAAIAFGLSMMIWTINLQNGSYQAMTRSAISQLAGHVVVQAQGYQDDPESTTVVTHADEVARVLADTFPDAIITERITLGGLLVSTTNNTGAGLRAVAPLAEAAVGDIDDKLVDGEWLTPDDTRGIVIGDAMAQTLGVQLGDKLVYMGQHGSDEMASRLFRVKGIFHSGAAELDGFVGFVHLDAGRELLAMDDVANQIAVHLDDADAAFPATDLAKQKLTDASLDIRSWRDALPELYALIQVDRKSSDVMMSVIGFIVAMGVLNTVLMSVLERTRELGVLMAIGMRPRRIALMVLLEGLVLGVLGTVSGVLLGLIPSWYTVVHGIDLTRYMGETFETDGIALSAVMTGAWDWDRMALYATAAVFFTMLAAAYPAWRVTQLTPIDAMRHH